LGVDFTSGIWDNGCTLIEEIFVKRVYEILSEVGKEDRNSVAYQYSDGVPGTLVAVVETEAHNEKEAIRNTANFCNMMDIVVHSVRLVN
tara:strand:- start:155 stop:421 length:267 start_codon:yes stop_codon:yes gene_type:complete